MRTTVVNIVGGKTRYDVYIGRPGRGQKGYFGNPFRLDREEDRVEVLQKYERYFYDRLGYDPEFKQRIHELKGKTLGCFCKPRLCHGDIIADYLNWEVQ